MLNMKGWAYIAFVGLFVAVFVAWRQNQPGIIAPLVVAGLVVGYLARR